MKQTHTLFEFTNTVNEDAAKYLTIPEFTMTLSFKKKASERFKITNEEDVAKICRLLIGDGTINWYESFIVIALNRNNEVINYYRASQGGVTGCIADPRIIMQFALACNATNIILCHNLPSGNTKPSRADEEVTRQIAGAGDLLSIKVLDHIIITENDFYSFALEGRL